jgi:hypothetical protein
MIQETIEIKSNILSSSHEPTAKEMKRFASAYTKTEWATLTDNFEFLSVFDHDLKEAKRIADELIPPPEKPKEPEKKKEG